MESPQIGYLIIAIMIAIPAIALAFLGDKKTHHTNH
jgi:hypothetical protein